MENKTMQTEPDRYEISQGIIWLKNNSIGKNWRNQIKNKWVETAIYQIICAAEKNHYELYGERYIKGTVVQKITTLSRTTIHEMTERNVFPKCLDIGSRKIWKASDIYAWMQKQEDKREQSK